MVSYRMIAVAGFLASVNALPLNINLGAYSPALVVGDGEISFGGGQDVTNLMNALEGAAVGAAAGSTGNAVAAASVPSTQESSVSTANAEPAQTIAAPPVASSASVPAAAAAVPEDPNLQEQATQISQLQGMGKEIAPREDSEAPQKRDLAGFDRALTFAEAALTKGPTIQLGTGEGGAGVGIIVDNTAGTVGRSNAAVAAANAAIKRDETSQPRRRTKVTRMYIKRGIPADIQASDKFEARSVETLPVVNLPTVSKRQSQEAIDAINLNVEGGEGITMTFVETTDDEDELDE
ncbi:hypothetical protein F5X96DRAFT_321256 [Biscogniauxia mediterranea]|nr:hypothetical protein F5X96DRAFT_321256 [Biscogniauxia mediterranea]